MTTYLRICLAMTLMAVVYCLPQEVYHHEVTHHKEQPMPYEFEYKVDDGEGTKQGRQEVGDESGTVKGWYGYNDANGVYRRVDYVADHHGFRAHINTNEPGTKNENPADVQIKAQEPPVIAQATHLTKIPIYHSQPKIVKVDAHPHHEAHPSYY